MVCTDDSASVVNAILQNDVQVETRSQVTSITKGFTLAVGNDREEYYDCVILATGNSHLGHH